MTYFRNYPEPCYSDWRSEPVPGWGVKPVMAGPARVGVGQYAAVAPPAAARPDSLALLRAALARQVAHEALPDEEQNVEAWKQACLDSDGSWDPVALTCTDQTAATGIAWWLWPIGAVVVLGAIGYVGTKKRWF